jgi:hypothetical protein
MVRAAACVLGSLIAGPYLDWVTNSGKLAQNYRYAYLWSGFFYIASLVCLLVVYRYWKKLGGDKGYQPPAT